MHMPGAAADRAIVTPAEAAQLAWQRLQPERWPLPPEAFPGEAALVGGAVRDALLRYRAGVAPITELLIAQRNLQAARSAEAAAIHRWNISRAGLELETGAELAQGNVPSSL